MAHKPRGACAACRHQRRRCDPDCLLAPFFPSNNPQQFLNAHRFYGVHNILRVIRGVDPSRRSDAMQSIIFECNARALDPVGGSYVVIRELVRQLKWKKTELEFAKRQLALCRSQGQMYGFANLGMNMNPGLMNTYVPMGPRIMPTPGMNFGLGSFAARPDSSNAVKMNEDPIVLDFIEDECQLQLQGDDSSDGSDE